MPKLLTTRGRRLVTVPGMILLAVGLVLTAPVWIVLAVLFDLLRGRIRLPLLRLLSFGLWWSVLETVGVAISVGLWIGGRAGRGAAHYRLQRWWSGRLVAGLRVLGGLRVEVEGIEALDQGPLIICSRHASLADALLPAWLLAETGPVRPRYVMKRELLTDPCLDIVGHRVPNCFVDRRPLDPAAELAGIERLARDMGPLDAAVIYPEGGVATSARRWRAMAKLVDRDPDRFSRLALLGHLVPPRANGTIALLRGAPDADVVLMTHVGLEGLARLTDAARNLPLRAPVRVRLERVPRAEIPPEAEIAAWLDDRWLEMDGWIGATRRPPGRVRERARPASPAGIS